MTNDEKEQLLDDLTVIHSQVGRLQIAAKENGKPDDVKRIAAEKKRLRATIDDLSRELLRDWIGDAEALRAEIIASSRGIEDAIGTIAKNIDVAESIVEALGYIDNAIEVATKLFI